MDAPSAALEPRSWRLDPLFTGCATAVSGLLVVAARCPRWPPESPIGWALEAHPGRATAALTLVLVAIAPTSWWSRGMGATPKMAHRGLERPPMGPEGPSMVYNPPAEGPACDRAPSAFTDPDARPGPDLRRT